MEDAKEARLSSAGNLVNVGNFDADGANVNNDSPDNSNDNLGVSFARSLCPPILSRGICLSAVGFFNPATEHPSDFHERGYQIQIAFFINGTDIKTKANNCFEYF